MDAFSAFSTSPTPSSSVGMSGIGAFSDQRRDGGQSPSSLLSAAVMSHLTNPTPVAGPFTTSTPLAVHPAQYRSQLHLQSTLDTEALDDKTMQRLSNTLRALQDIADGTHEVTWETLMDPEHPEESAQKLNAALKKPSFMSRSEALRVIASCMTTPRHLAIITHLDAEFKSEVRDLVLQELLHQLSRVRDDPLPLCAEMLVEMAQLKLVFMGGVAATVEQYLQEPEKVRAGLAVLGRAAERNRGSEAFLRAVHHAKGIEAQLCTLYKYPEYEQDVLSIIRLLSDPGSSAAMALLQPVCSLGDAIPVTCMQYFCRRDELVSGHADGNIVFWSGPQPSTGEVMPRCTVQLPPGHAPVAMSGPTRGQHLVVASMPCPSTSPYYRYLSTNATPVGAPTSAAKSEEVYRSAALRLMVCGDSTGVWKGSEYLRRPEGTAITAVEAPSNGSICVAESTAAAATGDVAQRHHNINLFDAAHGDIVRTIPNAHTDYTTVLTSCDGNDQLLLSGSRDTTVKLWDSRVSTAAAIHPEASVLPLNTLKGDHTDTISCIHTFRNAIFTGGLDGLLHVWDIRRTASPVVSRRFASPVLDVTTTEGGRIAVATARGLLLISLQTTGVVDVLPNQLFTELCTSNSGSVIFAGGPDGIRILSMRK